MAEDDWGEVSKVCISKGLGNRIKFHLVGDEEALKNSEQMSDLFIRRKWRGKWKAYKGRSRNKAERMKTWAKGVEEEWRDLGGTWMQVTEKGERDI